jgi:hypothetical protein
VVEAILIRNNADVCETAEENQRAKLVLLFWRRRFKPRPEVASTRSFEINSD